MSLHEAGIEEAVAPMGTALTGEQVSLLARLARRVVVVFDGDERLRQIFRERFDGDAGADLLADLPDERAVARENERGLRHRHDRPRHAIHVGRLLRARQSGRKHKRSNN